MKIILLPKNGSKSNKTNELKDIGKLIENYRRKYEGKPECWRCEHCKSFKTINDEKHKYKGGVTICSECLKKAEYGIRRKSTVDNKDPWTDDEWPKL